MAHFVTCQYCKARFDRDKEEYCLVSSKRYAHAACMLREAEKNPNFQKKEIIDPMDSVVCIFCKKAMSKKDEDCVMVSNGKYAHKGCKDLDDNREKTDKEKLEDYIKKLFELDYVEPRIQLQIKKFMDEYNYTYSGMQKALYYFYEIKKNDISKANKGIGIIPFIYNEAYNYHYNLWLAQQKNKDIEIYIPKVTEIKIKSPQRKVKKRPLFTFLDEDVEEVNDGIEVC